MNRIKRVSISALVLLFVAPCATSLYAQPQRKKVGVVLSGGGAKGVAHVNALKVIEEAGIPIDYIVGTSMGSIVGGLYAIGYTPAQLDSMFRNQNWNFLLSDRIKRSDMSLTDREHSEKYILTLPFVKHPKDVMAGGIIKGENISNLLSELTVGYHDSIDFNRLPIPFACVSENVVNGKEIVFHDGVLSTAIRASMAIPGVFTPVRQDSMVLIDGGMVNNFPVNVVKEMGADIIIGVDVQSELRNADQLNSAPDILKQIIDLACQNNLEKNMGMTDLYIKVNVDGYSSASFTPIAIETLLARGEKAARTHWDNLIALKEKIGIGDSYAPTPRAHYVPFFKSGTLFVKKIEFQGMEEEEKNRLMRKCKLQEDNDISMKQIKQALSELRGSQSYSSALYKLTETPEGYLLTFVLEEKYKREINLGIRFDSEEIATLLINATADLKTYIPSRISVTGRLGKRYAARIDYTFEPLQQRNINLSYMFQHNDLNIYKEGRRAFNTAYKYHLAEFGLSDVWFKNLRFSLGGRFEYYKYKDFLFKQPELATEIESQHFISYFGQLHYNTFDKASFPSKGSDFRAAYSLYTDNLAQYKGHAPFMAFKGSWESVVRLTNRFSILPGIYGRVLTGQDIPYAFQNLLGGNVFGLYTAHQLPFAGIVSPEIVNNSIIVASVKFRQRMGSIHYLTLKGNYGLTENDFFELLKGKHLFGISAGYGLDSMFGPLDITFGYSNQSKRGSCYVNLGYYF